MNLGNCLDKCLVAYKAEQVIRTPEAQPLQPTSTLASPAPVAAAVECPCSAPAVVRRVSRKLIFTVTDVLDDDSTPCDSTPVRSLEAEPEEEEAPAGKAAALAWVAAVTGVGAPARHGEMQEWLQSGVVLCELINTIQPGSVPRISRTGKGALGNRQGVVKAWQMENIGNYLEACSAVGVPAQDLFVMVDLYEGKNLAAVERNIHSLGRVAQALGFDGPQLGARLSTRNSRTFSDQQLALAKAMPRRWSQGSSSARLSFGEGSPSLRAPRLSGASSPSGSPQRVTAAY